MLKILFSYENEIFDKTNLVYFGHPFNYSFYVLVANNHII